MPDFHFLRPEWFYAVIPLLMVVLIQRKNNKLSGQWKNIVSPALQAYILNHSAQENKKSYIRYGLLLASVLTIIALAGPSWKKQPSQVFSSQAGLIIALDLSLSMSAQDVSPSRLQRAKYKILDILEQNIGSNIALIAFAGDAHVASPLTRDIKTIQAMLPALDPYIMPSQGSNISNLVDESIKLFEQGKSSPKTLLIVGDGIEKADINYAASALKQHNINLSVLAVGTEQGAPIVQPDGRFFKDNQGQVIMPGLEWENLSEFVEQSQGRIHKLSNNDSDIKYLTNIANLSQGYEASEESIVFDQWFDSGYWLILPILVLSLISFRKGILLSLALILLPVDSSWAEQSAEIHPQLKPAPSLPDILLNDNQVAYKHFPTDPKHAATLFNDSNWKASSLYKAKDYEGAINAWANSHDTESLYNKANALAHLNRLDEALSTYDKVLKNNPDHKDAKFNKALVEKMKQQQESQSKDQNSDQQNQDKSNSQNQQAKDQQNQKGEQSQDQQSQNSEQSEADQNQSSDNPAKQQDQTDKDGEQQSTEQQASENPEKDENQQKQQMASQQQSDNETTEQDSLTPQQISKNAEQEQAMQQWMERIPDDPGGLLRNKFLYQYKNRNKNDQNGERKPW